MLHVIHANDLQKVEDTVKHYEQHLKAQHYKIIEVDVEYTNELAHEQKAALVQLTVSKTQPVLLFQLSAGKDKCMVFYTFLLDPRYTFAGFFIDQDIEKLQRVGMEINQFINIHKEWRMLERTNYFDSLGDASSILIDDYYINMKSKLTYEDHRRWERMPLSEKHIFSDLHYTTVHYHTNIPNFGYDSKALHKKEVHTTV
ncbi:hypothetical protein D1007_08735 [Hordeum vulgare]|nr:hypothetical protein D1007_08735 [Hordeum vulgare]